jgi:hypothetical protein
VRIWYFGVLVFWWQVKRRKNIYLPLRIIKDDEIEKNKIQEVAFTGNTGFGHYCSLFKVGYLVL